MEDFFGGTPLQVANKQKCLAHEILADDGIITRKTMIERAVKAGAIITEKLVIDKAAVKKAQAQINQITKKGRICNPNHPQFKLIEELQQTVNNPPNKTERRLTHPNGSFKTEADTTKTGMDYAEFLLKNRQN